MRPALGQLNANSIDRLPSALRLSALGRLSDADLSGADTILQQLAHQANELAKLAQDEGLESRLRLYARVAGWLRDIPPETRELLKCPICQAPLLDKLDPVTSRPIHEHLSEFLTRDVTYLERPIKAWEQVALARIAKNLPTPLRNETERDLPGRPTDLIASALAEELFEHPCFSGDLAPFQAATRLLCEEALAGLPPFAEPEPVPLPAVFGPNSPFRQTFDRARRAIAFARWRRENAASCKSALDAIIGSVEHEGERPSVTAGSPLADRLAALDEMVRRASPLREALPIVKRMITSTETRREKEKRIELYAQAAEAIKDLLGIGELVDLQVASLVNKLSSKTEQWKKSLYSPAFVGAPRIVRTDVRQDGSLIAEAEAEGTRASAYHISNASDLRATLLAFLLAFWEHILKSGTGLSLMLLDDPQEMFDPHNRHRVAGTLPKIVERGGRVVVTTNDPAFQDRVAITCRRMLGSDQADQRRIHTLRAARPVITLGRFREAIDERRTAFDDPTNENDPGPARNYVNELRIYIENRLGDLFDTPEPGLPENPTLSDLLAAIRSRRSKGMKMFSDQTFGALVSDPALRDGSGFLALMNKSHHGESNEITYVEVREMANSCLRVRKLVDDVREVYMRWLRRDVAEPRPDRPSAPECMRPLTLEVPVAENLAALTSDSAPGDPHMLEERFTANLLGNHAVYLVNTNNLGFAVPRNSLLIVDLSEADVPDNSLVIALHREKTYARRLLRDQTEPSLIVLACEAVNPEDRISARFLPTVETRLLRVAGVLFNEDPPIPRPIGEAVLSDLPKWIERIEIGFRVSGDSALPLALPGQTVLVGEQIFPNQLAGMEGAMVALDTTEGSAFKRVGEIVPVAGYLREFEPVGGLGQPMFVKTEDIEDGAPDLPVLRTVRRVLGVWYDPL